MRPGSQDVIQTEGKKSTKIKHFPISTCTKNKALASSTENRKKAPKHRGQQGAIKFYQSPKGRRSMQTNRRKSCFLCQREAEKETHAQGRDQSHRQETGDPKPTLACDIWGWMTVWGGASCARWGVKQSLWSPPTTCLWHPFPWASQLKKKKKIPRHFQVSPG